MWNVSLRDLLFRRRRFAIAVVATALVFAMTMLLSGVLSSIHDQNRRMVASFGADAWIVAAGVSGPFTATTVIPASSADRVAAAGGVSEADPIVVVPSTLREKAGATPLPVNIVGVRPGGLGSQRATKGRDVQRPGEVVTDSGLGFAIGQAISAGGHELTVVGTAPKITYFFGQRTLVMPIADAQAIAYGGQALASAVVTKGVPERLPDDLAVRTEQQVRDDLELPAKSATQTIQFLNVLLWIIAAGIIGSMIYLSSMERTRDFAVLKATGTSNRALLGDLALQAVILALAAAFVAALLARFVLAPVFPFEVAISTSTYLTLPLVAIAVGLIASLAGLRRAVSIEPALAFGGA